MDNNIEIIKLLQEQMSVMQVFFEEKITRSNLNLYFDLVMDDRAYHLKCFDQDYYAIFKRKQDEKIEGLCKKMGENAKKINELIKTTPPTVTPVDRYVCPNDGEPY